MPQVSLIIPTNRPTAVLKPCLASIAAQEFDLRDIEVLIAVNGLADPAAGAGPVRVATAGARSAHKASTTSAPFGEPSDWPFPLRVLHLPEPNIGAAKNAALDGATGDWIILLNDDVQLEPDFIARHLAAHRQVSRPAMVLGRSNWPAYEDETVFDRMIADTPMVFFYPGLRPHAWHDFRHAWNLNLSLPRRFVEGVRFDARLGPFFYEDLELAFRLERAHDLRVWYDPRAALLHRHRYTLAGYLQREREMGAAASRLWTVNPACFRAIYRADLDDAYLDYCRQFIVHEGRYEERLRAELGALATLPSRRIAETPQVRNRLVNMLYQGHIPLKRLAFRRGLLDACTRQPNGQSVSTYPDPSRPCEKAVLAGLAS